MHKRIGKGRICELQEKSMGKSVTKDDIFLPYPYHFTIVLWSNFSLIYLLWDIGMGAFRPSVRLCVCHISLPEQNSKIKKEILTKLGT